MPLFDTDRDNRLNACLRVLALEVFPDCDIQFLRERVLRYPFAHIEQVTDELLRLGHWPERLNYGQMEDADGIRSERYKHQALKQLVKEFPEIWKSSVQAVLAENNWDYLKSRDQLQRMGSGGFWNSIKNFLIHWNKGARRTQYAQLDPQLEEQLISLERQRVNVQESQDLILAKEINQKEYDGQNQLITCDCCFGDYTFEELLFCSEGKHAFCHECVNRYITEGLFGQGILRARSWIDCIASSDACSGCLPARTLKQVLPSDLWMAYEQSHLDNCEQNKVQCCSCAYFEYDDSVKQLETVPVVDMVRRIVGWFMWNIESDLNIAYGRIKRARRGQVFRCKNPKCQVWTCLECQRPFRGLHQCWEKENDGLRLYVERAMAEAVKRTVLF
ncbi:Putative RING finger protein [Rhizopus microsporus]|nr:Putative RING finger protein [Rhizopus microsporus]